MFQSALRHASYSQAYRQIYNGSLAPKVSKLLRFNMGVALIGIPGCAGLTFKYQSTHKQWTYRQTVSTIGCIAFAGITLFVKRKLGNLYVFSIDKFPRNFKDPQKYRANFYGGKSIEFYSHNVYLASETELGPFTSFYISGRAVFVNSADMHYYAHVDTKKVTSID